MAEPKEADPWARFNVAPDGTPEDPWAKYDAGKPPPESGGAWQGVQDFARIAGNSASYGTLDRLRGAIDMGGDKPYGEATDEHVRKSMQARERLGPFMSGTADAVGGIAPVVGAVKSGITFASNAAPQLWRRMTAGAVEGGLHGGLQGAGSTYTGEIGDYAANAGKGAVLGSVFGAGAPAVAKGVGAAYAGMANRGWFGGHPAELARAAQTDAATLTTMQARLGPRAMLAEGGPALQGTAQGAILGQTMPGQARLRANMDARNDSAGDVVVNTIDRQLGTARPPSYVEREVGERMSAMGPAYDAALSRAGRIDTQAIDNRLLGDLSRAAGQNQTAINYWRQQLQIPTNPGALDPNPLRIQGVRTALREQIRDPNNVAIRDTLERIDRHLTDELQRQVPGIRELDHAYAELGAQQRAVQSDSAGGRMFKKDQNTTIWPEELRDTMTEAVQPKGVNVGPSAEPLRLRQAARAELERSFRNNPNDLNAVEKVLQKPEDWNSQKLAVMFGEERAATIMRVIEAERVFRDSHTNIVGGAQTATRLKAAQATDRGGEIPTETIGRPFWGDVKAFANWARKKIGDASTDATRDRIANIMATNDPQAIQRLIPELLATQPNREARESAVRILVQQGIIGGGGGLGAQSFRTDKERRR